MEEKPANQYNIENTEIREDITEEQRKHRKTLEYIRIITVIKLVNVRSFNHSNMKHTTKKVDEIVKYILTKDVLKTKDLIRSTLIFVG